MGGYEAPGTGSVLDFAGTAHEGLEVTVDSVSIGVMLDILQDYSALTAENVTPAKAAGLITSLTGSFGAVLESWNVTRRGEPVPPTAEGLRSLDSGFVMDVVGAWLTGTAAAPPPLPGSSPSGGPSPEELAQMAAQSSSLPSSSPQRLLSGSATGGTACRRSC
jgi:hypothetical protein